MKTFKYVLGIGGTVSIVGGILFSSTPFPFLIGFVSLLYLAYIQYTDVNWDE